AVLFTQRMPTGIGEFLGRILHYQARVYAHGQFLLTDEYPSFEVGPVDYPVMLQLGEPERFNRAAVLFRFFLQLPALIVTQLISTGVVIILFFVWLVTLVAGQMPTSAYLALSAILRYQLRTWAYMGMLTTDYPRGLFGDRDEMSPSSAFVDEVDAPLPSSPRIDRLVLTRGAKLIVALSLVFGVGWLGVNIATASFSFHLNLGRTAELTDASNAFDDAYDSWEARSAACGAASAPECQRAANAALSSSIQRYEARLAGLAITQGALDEYTVVRVDLDEMRTYLTAATETSASEGLMRSRFQVEDAKFVYDRDLDRLLRAVTFD
ncbi:MAG: hypothetical protein QOD30_1293, partial [Actinomycetota bacterium]|nr:hypothetical protein [Actinomycetota bacterium]